MLLVIRFQVFSLNTNKLDTIIWFHFFGNGSRWFMIIIGLRSLFNGISVSVCYSMLKSSMLKNSSDIIQPIAGRIKRFITKTISPKMNIIVRLEFEFTNFEASGQHISRYAMGIPQQILILIFSKQLEVPVV